MRLAGLNQLTQVDLSYCDTTTLELENLPALKNAAISSCGQLCELSLSGLDNLETLDLQACSSLAELPESIGGLVNLKSLNLSGSSLVKLPASIGGLVNLKTLNLSGSSLVELPASIGGLAALTELDLSSTGLESLPAMIGQLKSLKTLVLPYQIKEVPRELGQLPGLRKLYFGSSYGSVESATRIILDLCRQLDLAAPRDPGDSG